MREVESSRKSGMLALLPARERSQFERHLILAINEWEPTDEEAGLAAISRALPLTESPIERIVLPYLVFHDYGGALMRPAVVGDSDDVDGWDDACPLIVPQYKIDGMRVDFLVVFSLLEEHRFKVIVE